MRLAPQLVTAPAAEPIALADVKRHLRIETSNTDDDTLLESLIDAAIAYLDGYTGILRRCLINQTWVEKWEYFPGVRIPLRLAPVSSVTHVKYYDGDDVLQTVSASDYSLQTGPGGSYVVVDNDAAWPDVYPRDDAVQITYVAGYGASGTSVPAPIIHAMRLHIERLYEGANWPDAPAHVAAEMALLAPYRRIDFS